jgi:hypothetical protein
MKMDSPGVATHRHVILMMVACLVASACSPKAGATIYYVDYQAGSDGAPGTAPDKAWKHAPGDSLAKAGPASVKLKPGDTVLFRGGVAYRGALRLNAAGTQDAQITFAGDQWGTEPAIFDGADPVQSARPCPSAEACGGASNWSKLSLISFQTPPTTFIKFFDAKGALFESQYPGAKDPFFSDDVAQYAELPQRDAVEDSQGHIRSTALAKVLADGWYGAQLSLWVQGNDVVRRPVTGVTLDAISYGGAPTKLYTDRSNRVVIVNLPGLIDRPGFYATVGPSAAVAWLRPDGGPNISIGSGRKGIDIRGQSDVVIRGFVFQHFVEGKYGEGIQITNSGDVASRVQILKNTFRQSALFSGVGPVMIGRVDDSVIGGNIFADIERGSGIRMNLKPISRLRIVDNTFKRLGRTGISVFGASDTTVTGNLMEELYGIHGNGISAYWDNRGVLIANNRILNTTRPVTVEGKPNEDPGEHRLVIDHNVFVSTDPAGAAIISWGKVRTMTITNNVLIGPKNGLLLSPSDTGVVVTQNYTTGISTKGPQPGDWTIKDNKGVSKDQLRDATVAQH